MVVFHSCKNEENPIKNEGARVLTRLCRFLDTQGQLSPKSAVEFSELRTHQNFYSCPRYLQE